jgi:hypothetical protein
MRQLEQAVEMPVDRSSRFPHSHRHDDYDEMNLISKNNRAKGYAF